MLRGRVRHHRQGDEVLRLSYEVMAMKDGGFLLKQEVYVRDILDKYQVQGVEMQPVPRIEGAKKMRRIMKKKA